MASQVADAFATKERIDASKIWNGSFLPPAAERDIFRK
jgi:NitT/TauT family transport system substrate-binding protein